MPSCILKAVLLKFLSQYVYMKFKAYFQATYIYVFLFFFSFAITHISEVDFINYLWSFVFLFECFLFFFLRRKNEVKEKILHFLLCFSIFWRKVILFFFSTHIAIVVVIFVYTILYAAYYAHNLSSVTHMLDTLHLLWTRKKIARKTL